MLCNRIVETHKRRRGRSSPHERFRITWDWRAQVLFPSNINEKRRDPGHPSIHNDIRTATSCVTLPLRSDTFSSLCPRYHVTFLSFFHSCAAPQKKDKKQQKQKKTKQNTVNTWKRAKRKRKMAVPWRREKENCVCGRRWQMTFRLWTNTKAAAASIALCFLCPCLFFFFCFEHLLLLLLLENCRVWLLAPYRWWKKTA